MSHFKCLYRWPHTLFPMSLPLASRFSPVPLTLRSLDLWTQKLYCAPLLVHCPPCTTGPCIARFLQSSKADCGNKLTIAIELKSSFLFPKGRVGPYQQPALPPNRTGQAMSCFVSLQTDFIFENTKKLTKTDILFSPLFKNINWRPTVQFQVAWCI